MGALMDTVELLLPQPLMDTPVMLSQLHVLSQKHPLLKRSSNPSNNGDIKSNTKCLQIWFLLACKQNTFVGRQKKSINYNIYNRRAFSISIHKSTFTNNKGTTLKQKNIEPCRESKIILI